MLLHHEINNIDIKYFFYCSIKLCAISSRTKSIQQGLHFPWFLKRATTSGKISSRIKLRLRSNSTNATSSSDLFQIFLNKTQLKIKIKIEFFLTGSNPTTTKLGLRSNSTNATLSSDLLLIFQIKHN
jgi:hypothetical protein